MFYDSINFLPPAPFIAWKGASGKLVKLEISERDKCKCDSIDMYYAPSASVLAIEEIDGTIPFSDSVASYENPDFIYTVGKTVEPLNKDEPFSGIYFFLSRARAVQYIYDTEKMLQEEEKRNEHR